MIGEIGSTVKHKASGKIGIVVDIPKLKDKTHTVVSHDFDCEHVIADCALELIEEKFLEEEKRDEHDDLYDDIIPRAEM